MDTNHDAKWSHSHFLYIMNSPGGPLSMLSYGIYFSTSLLGVSLRKVHAEVRDIQCSDRQVFIRFQKGRTPLNNWKEKLS